MRAEDARETEAVGRDSTEEAAQGGTTAEIIRFTQPSFLEHCDSSIRALHAFWDGLRRGMPIPRRDDLSFDALPVSDGTIALVEVRDNEPRFVYRDAGPIRKRQPATGKQTALDSSDGLADLDQPLERALFGPLLNAVRRRFEQVASTAAALYEAAGSGGGSVTDETIYLPLSGADGRVELILVYSHTPRL